MFRTEIPTALKTCGIVVSLAACGAEEAPPPLPDHDAAAVTATPAPYPVSRGYAHLIYHPPTEQMILFGGEANQRVSLEDVWSYSVAANAWTELPAEGQPQDADGTAVAYDSESDRIIFHFTTRLDPAAERGLARISETWAYEVGTNTWTNMNPDPAPFGLMGARAVYAADADRVILFGGADFTVSESPRFNETWAYDFNRNTWERRHPREAPPGRSYFGMAYDAVANVTLSFAGSFSQQDESRAAELWAYDYSANTWTMLEYTGDVPPDHHPYMVYAAGLDKTLYIVNRAFWAFDYSTRTWTSHALDEAFGVRHFHAMAYDERRERLVVFGGGPRGLRYDNTTWVYEPGADQWTLAAGGEGSAAAGS